MRKPQDNIDNIFNSFNDSLPFEQESTESLKSRSSKLLDKMKQSNNFKLEPVEFPVKNISNSRASYWISGIVVALAILSIMIFADINFNKADRLFTSSDIIREININSQTKAFTHDLQASESLSEIQISQLSNIISEELENNGLKFSQFAQSDTSKWIGNGNSNNKFKIVFQHSEQSIRFYINPKITEQEISNFKEIIDSIEMKVQEILF